MTGMHAFVRVRLLGLSATTMLFALQILQRELHRPMPNVYGFSSRGRHQS
jgi:hypothetical protein